MRFMEMGLVVLATAEEHGADRAGSNEQEPACLLCLKGGKPKMRVELITPALRISRERPPA
jgi:hypothetical protein